MKLAIVTTHPIQYYAPVFQLLAKKVELKVFYTAAGHRAYDPGFQCEIHWDIPLLTGYDYEWINYKTIIRQVADFNPQCLLIYGWAAKGHLTILRHFNNRSKIFFRGDSTLLKQLPWWRAAVRKVVLKWVYAQVHSAFYTGSNNKAYFKKYGLKDSQLVFAPHAIDNERFAMAHPSVDLRKTLGVGKDEVLVLFTGKFNTNKNVLLLLQAFVEADVKHTHLLFVGSGALDAELRAAAQRHQNVHVLPFQNQQLMPAFYQACDLFCLPSKHESWGLSINEAMACGKAVLVSDHCGAALDLVNELNGRIFKVNQAGDLKAHLHYLLNNLQFLKKAGAHSRQLIQQWSFNVQVENMMKGFYD
jgi:glycosyltransferase involved in cell wall biosynthesis